MAERPVLRVDAIARPATRRLSPSHPAYGEILTAHSAAVDVGRPVYQDPISGWSVFTAVFLARRGYCCESGCRHCPYVED